MPSGFNPNLHSARKAARPSHRLFLFLDSRHHPVRCLAERVYKEQSLETAERQGKDMRPESKREFLTLDEVRKLEDTPYIKENIRRAFLFTCYCGLRVGDVTDLCWSDISVNGGQHFVSVVMQKNSKPISLPLPAKALSWLPERGRTGGIGILASVPYRPEQAFT